MAELEEFAAIRELAGGLLARARPVRGSVEVETWRTVEATWPTARRRRM